MALAWKAGWVNSPQGFESPILRHLLLGPSPLEFGRASRTSFRGSGPRGWRGHRPQATSRGALIEDGDTARELDRPSPGHLECDHPQLPLVRWLTRLNSAKACSA